MFGTLIFGVPEELELGIARAIIAGMERRARVEGVTILGGHTWTSNELLLGMSVTGKIPGGHQFRKNNSPNAGDKLIVTKRIGLTYALYTKYHSIADEDIQDESELLSEIGLSSSLGESVQDVSACTDVSGYGVVGHLLEMVQGAGLGAELRYSQLLKVMSAAVRTKFPRPMFCGLEKNRKDFEPNISNRACLFIDPLFAPETNGPYLMAVNANKVNSVLDRLRMGGCPNATIIGELKPMVESVEVLDA